MRPILAAALLGFCVAAATPSGAGADAPQPSLVIAAARLCWDVPSFRYEPGVPVQLYRCHAGANQAFTLRSDGAFGAGGTLCVGVAADDSGQDTLALGDCTGTAVPRWTRGPGDTLVAADGRCLTVPADGAVPLLAACGAAAASQRWWVVPPADERWKQPGQPFRDCFGPCPAMVMAPAGSFRMGAAPGEEALAGVPPHLRGHAEPQHRVVIPRPLAVAVTETTGAAWRACVAAGGCRAELPGEPGPPGERNPQTYVTWDDAQAYGRWLARLTGLPYRLPTEAEWEYLARAGTTASRSWGMEIGTGRAWCRGCESTGFPGAPQTVGAFPPNPWDLADMLGNVWEWVADCYVPGYEGGLVDGSARTVPDCRDRVLRGGSWIAPAWQVRSAARAAFPPGRGTADIGFRVVRDLVLDEPAAGTR